MKVIMTMKKKMKKLMKKIRRRRGKKLFASEFENCRFPLPPVRCRPRFYNAKDYMPHPNPKICQTKTEKYNQSLDMNPLYTA